MSSPTGYTRSSQRASSTISPLRSRKSPTASTKPSRRPTTLSSSSISSRPLLKLSESPVAATNASDVSKAKENVIVTVRFRPLSFGQYMQDDHTKVVSVHQDSGVMESSPVKRNWPASAQNANAKIPWVVMIADAVMAYTTCEKVTCVLGNMLLHWPAEALFGWLF
ncbi:uncharacterized protein LOC133299781 [Gastrolobium bilobum]|uniref:uncharacterized protein LOC133299781 n=1 Tax=Gastrolobium bilobum TaxID=150636 RepID=UPI002AB18A80|nr:uncharacterized protein LOC133299781 [Gastrolobium bilobum]